MSASYDVIVVGAGIVGAACARACALGGMRVLVLDQGPIGAGATAAGMGHIVVMDDSEAQFALTAYSRGLWLELAPELPPDTEFDHCGTLWVAADDEEMQEVWRKHAFYQERGVRTEVLDAAAVAETEPRLRPGLAGALRVPDDAVIYPPCAAKFLLRQAQSAGAQVCTRASVRALLRDGGVELVDGERIPAPRTVNACGSASGNLTEGLPIRPRKGHLLITDRYPGYVHHQIVELGYLKSAHAIGTDSVAFNIQPRKTGQMLIGSSRQYGSTSPLAEAPILRRMLARASEYLPTLHALSAIRVWTGFRAATPDKLPLIGPSATCENIWLATGHEGLGITTSLATGALLADLLLGRPCQIDAAPFDPSRHFKESLAHA